MRPPDGIISRPANESMTHATETRRDKHCGANGGKAESLTQLEEAVEVDLRGSLKVDRVSKQFK